jgi:disulfide bond formation protein DsbB
MSASRRLPLVVLVASAAVLGGALVFQYVVGLRPCELCLYQRWPYDGAILIALAALVAGRRALTSAALGLCALGFLVGAGLAFYHVGVEQRWFAGPAACTGAPAAATTAEELRKQLLAEPVVRCDEPQWSLFGISLAGWNLLASLALAVFCLDARRRPELRRTA